MFWNIYSKRLLSSIRNKDQLIWIWAFPLILATLFYFCLSSVAEADHLRRAHLDGHARAQEPACEGRLAGNASNRRKGTGIPLSPRTRPPPGLACPASLFRGKKAMTKKAAPPP